jgi:protein SCO1/2
MDMSSALEQKQRNAIRTTVILLAVVVTFAFAAIFYKFVNAKPALKDVLAANSALMFEVPRLLPEVNLVTHDGKPFTTDQFKGQWDLINFGYTYCPDICPTNMADMNIAAKQLEAEGFGGQVNYWMVTVDPARDTVEQLSLYVPYFNPEFIGLTGDPDAIATLARPLSAVYYQEGTGEGYTVAHSDNYAVIDPNGHFVAMIRPPHRPTAIAATLKAFIQSR